MKGYAQGWEGWRKDEWRQCLDKRSLLTTVGALQEHCCPNYGPCTAAGLKFTLGFVLLVITALISWSFLCVQTHLSWSCLSIFLEVLVFCLRPTQMTSQLCGNHRRNCQWCFTIYRRLPGYALSQIELESIYCWEVLSNGNTAESLMIKMRFTVLPFSEAELNFSLIWSLPSWSWVHYWFSYRKTKFM